MRNSTIDKKFGVISQLRTRKSNFKEIAEFPVLYKNQREFTLANQENLNEFIAHFQSMAKLLGLKLVSNEDSRIAKRAIYDLDFLKMIDSNHRGKIVELLPKSYSQQRQDLFVLSQLNFKENGYFVDFGAAGGVHSSNSHLLENCFGWKGILAEAAISWHDELERNRSVHIEKKSVWSKSNETILFNETNPTGLSTIDMFSDSDMHAKSREKGRRYNVETISLLDLLEKYNAPRNINYLSIDTEGSEYQILKDFDFNKYTFDVITCEHNLCEFQNDILNLLTKNGYKKVNNNMCKFEDWYVYSGN